jgi:hypothetical protein
MQILARYGRCKLLPGGSACINEGDCSRLRSFNRLPTTHRGTSAKLLELKPMSARARQKRVAPVY